MMQHIHYMGAAHAFRVVEASLRKAARLQLRYAFLRQREHVAFAAEMNGTGRTGLHTGRLLADADAIHAQGAFVGAVILFVEPGHVERATRNAVAAADTLLRLEIDDAVGVLNNGTCRRTGFQAAGIGAVHAAIFANQPGQLAVLFNFRETHHRP